MAPTPTFEVSTTANDAAGTTLLIGVSTPGLAGLTAVDYLVKQQPSTMIGHITTHDIPAVTPFEAGEPRLPLRIYDLPELDLTILVGESFVPVWAADRFTESLLDWISSTDIDEIAVLHGVPYPHGPEEHSVFYVGPRAYTSQLADADIEPLPGGFLDGVPAQLLTNSLAGPAPPTGVLVTPAHPPGPDFDAALLFLETIEAIYGVEVEEKKLRRRAEEMDEYFDELATRIQKLESGDQPMQSRDFPVDRMFM